MGHIATAYSAVTLSADTGKRTAGSERLIQRDARCDGRPGGQACQNRDKLQNSVTIQPNSVQPKNTFKMAMLILFGCPRLTAMIAGSR